MEKDILEFIEKQQKLVDAKLIDGAHAASSILFEMAEEEAQTNSRYAAAIEFAAQCIENGGDPEGAEYIRSQGREIMGDEDNHCTKFKFMASECIDVKEPAD